MNIFDTMRNAVDWVENKYNNLRYGWISRDELAEYLDVLMAGATCKEYEDALSDIWSAFIDE